MCPKRFRALSRQAETRIKTRCRTGNLARHFSARRSHTFRGLSMRAPATIRKAPSTIGRNKPRMPTIVRIQPRARRATRSSRFWTLATIASIQISNSVPELQAHGSGTIKDEHRRQGARRLSHQESICGLKFSDTLAFHGCRTRRNGQSGRGNVVRRLADWPVPRSAGNREHERQSNRYRQNSNDHTEGYRGWEMPMPECVEPRQLEPNTNQDERQAIAQQVESCKGTGQQKIHRAQAQNSEHVRRVDDQRLAGNRKRRGNGVDSEKNIGRLDENERQENGRCV